MKTCDMQKKKRNVLLNSSTGLTLVTSELGLQ